MNHKEMNGVSTDAHTKSEKSRFLSFTLGGEEYATPLVQVKEVIAVPKVRAVPNSPRHCLGLMDLRGQVLPVMDLRIKLQTEKAENSKENVVIVFDTGSACVGAIVDSIDRVFSIEKSQITETPEMTSGVASQYLSGVARAQDKLVFILDVVNALA